MIEAPGLTVGLDMALASGYDAAEVKAADSNDWSSTIIRPGDRIFVQ